MNTRVDYEYRDGANYRFHASVVVAGEMTDALWRRLRAACDPETEGFIAHQVGFPEVFGFLPGQHIGDPESESTGYRYDEETDHCWHSLSNGDEPWGLTHDVPTDSRTVEQVVKAFEAAKAAGWKPFDPAERFEL